MLRTHARVVQTGGDGVRLLDLAILILKQHGETAVQNAGAAEGQGRGVAPGAPPTSPGLDSDDFDTRVRHERVESTDGVRTASHACDDRVRESTRLLEYLCTGLAADHSL